MRRPNDAPGLRSIAFTFGPELWDLRLRFLLAYTVTLTAIGASLAAPLIVRLIIDALIEGHVKPSLLDEAVAGWRPEWLILALGATLLAVSAIGALAESGDGLITARVRERLGLRIRTRMLGHLQSLPPTIRTTHRSGELVLRLVGDVDQVTRLHTKTVPLLVRHAAMALLTLAGLAWLSPRVGLACLVSLPALFLMVRHHGRAIGATTRAKRRWEGDVAGLAQEIVRGLPVIQATGGSEISYTRFAAVSEESLRSGVTASRATARLERSFELARGVVLSVVTAGGALLVLGGRLSVGDLTVIVAYVTQLLRPIDKINDLSEALSRGLAAGERLVALLALRPAVEDAPGAIDPGRARGRLTLDNVWFAYPGTDAGQTPVLRGVSATFEPGELAVLIGRSGAGKSTLLGLIVRLFDPTSGRIRLDGHSLPALALRGLRRQFALMTQDLHLFSGTLRQAIAVDAGGVEEARIWEALSLVALDGFVRSLPHGLDTPLGEDGVNLSGGQRQRLSLARAFLQDRPVLLLDEPLSNVDAESAEVILRALARIRAGRTCVAITHESSLVSHADRVYRLEGGRLAEDRHSRRLLEAVR